jgi:predicted DNA-binding protein (UPF0251 family)
VNRRVVPFAWDYMVDSDGGIWSTKYGSPRLLKPWPNNKGYQMVSLCVGGGVKKYLVHRIVGLVFCDGAAPGLEVRHKDDNPKNCRADNLVWGTHLDNMADMVERGRHASLTHPERVARGERHSSRTKPHRVPRGERSGAATINEAQVREIRLVFAELRNISKTARRVGVSRDAAKFVINGKTWKHVA